MKIAVAIPHTGTLKAACAKSLGELLICTTGAQITYNGTITRPEIALLFEEAGPLEYKRTRLALVAREWGADYILWIDSDQTFPPDALLRLAKHDLAIVGCNYPIRHESHGPSALDLRGRPVTGSGVQEVGSVGFGFVLMKAPVFDKVPHPWFAVEISPDGRLVVGEDVHFCNQARRAGLSVYVDHDLAIGHIAEEILSLEGGSANAGSVLSEAGNE